MGWTQLFLTPALDKNRFPKLISEIVSSNSIVELSLSSTTTSSKFVQGGLPFIILYFFLCFPWCFFVPLSLLLFLPYFLYLRVLSVCLYLSIYLSFSLSISIYLSFFLYFLLSLSIFSLCLSESWARFEHFKKWDVIFSWRDAGDMFYVVLSGRLEVRVPSRTAPCPNEVHAEASECTCLNREMIIAGTLEQGRIIAFLRDVISRLSFLLQNPRTPEGFPEGFPEGVSEGFLEGPFKTPWKRLQEPFQNLSRRCRNRWCTRLPDGRMGGGDPPKGSWGQTHIWGLSTKVPVPVLGGPGTSAKTTLLETTLLRPKIPKTLK